MARHIAMKRAGASASAYASRAAARYMTEHGGVSGSAGLRAQAAYYGREPGEMSGLVEWQVRGPDGKLVVGADGMERRSLDESGLELWMQWLDPETGEQRGQRPRRGAERSSVLYSDYALTMNKTLSLAAALNDDVKQAVVQAKAEAADLIAAHLAKTARVRVTVRDAEGNAVRNERGNIVQTLVPVERLEVVFVEHEAARPTLNLDTGEEVLGDPHLHTHILIGQRVQYRDPYTGTLRWGALDTVTLRNDAGEIDAIADAAITTNSVLREALAAHLGTSLDNDGEVIGLTDHVERFSKRHAEIKAEEAAQLSEWYARHPNEVPGEHLRAKLDRDAHRTTRQGKDYTETREQRTDRWREELTAAGVRFDDNGHLRDGFAPARELRPITAVSDIPERRRHSVAVRAVDATAAERSAWNRADLAKQVRALLPDLLLDYDRETGEFRHYDASPELVAEIIETVTAEAAAGCLDILDPDKQEIANQRGVRAMTSANVIALEYQLRTDLAALAHEHLDVDDTTIETAIHAHNQTAQHPLTDGQAEAVKVMAGSTRLGVVTGVAGSGKTTATLIAEQALTATGRHLVTVAPTNKAALEAGKAIQGEASSLDRLLWQYGLVPGQNGTWRQLNPGDWLPDYRSKWQGVSKTAPRLDADTTILVDEAGMIDQNRAAALLNLVNQTGARLVLMGDATQLGAIGRGGVLDFALEESIGAQTAEIRQAVRFTTSQGDLDTGYADTMTALRAGDRAAVKDLARRDLILPGGQDHASALAAMQATIHDRYDPTRVESYAMVQSNNDANALNRALLEQLQTDGAIQPPPANARPGLDGAAYGVGALVMTRTNDRKRGVLNRQTWLVAGHTPDGGYLLQGSDGTRRTLATTGGTHYDGLHAAYAVTQRAAQGITTTGGFITLADDTTSLDALYVGASRDTRSNLIIVQAETLHDAQETLAAILDRDTQDRGVQHAATRAADQVQNLVVFDDATGQGAINIEAITAQTPQPIPDEPVASSIPEPAAAEPEPERAELIDFETIAAEMEAFALAHQTEYDQWQDDDETEHVEIEKDGWSIRIGIFEDEIYVACDHESNQSDEWLQYVTATDEDAAIEIAQLWWQPIENALQAAPAVEAADPIRDAEQDVLSARQHHADADQRANENWQEFDHSRSVVRQAEETLAAARRMQMPLAIGLACHPEAEQARKAEETLTALETEREKALNSVPDVRTSTTEDGQTVLAPVSRPLSDPTQLPALIDQAASNLAESRQAAQAADPRNKTLFTKIARGRDRLETEFDRAQRQVTYDERTYEKLEQIMDTLDRVEPQIPVAQQARQAAQTALRTAQERAQAEAARTATTALGAADEARAAKDVAEAAWVAANNERDTAKQQLITARRHLTDTARLPLETTLATEREYALAELAGTEEQPRPIAATTTESTWISPPDENGQITIQVRLNPNHPLTASIDMQDWTQWTEANNTIAQHIKGAQIWPTENDEPIILIEHKYEPTDTATIKEFTARNLTDAGITHDRNYEPIIADINYAAQPRGYNNFGNRHHHRPMPGEIGVGGMPAPSYRGPALSGPF